MADRHDRPVPIPPMPATMTPTYAFNLQSIAPGHAQGRYNDALSLLIAHHRAAKTDRVRTACRAFQKMTSDSYLMGELEKVATDALIQTGSELLAIDAAARFIAITRKI